MKQLDSNAPLSSVLSQVRLMANMTGDMLMVALTDMLTYGLLNVPFREQTFTDPTYKKAGLEYIELCGMEDITKLNIDEIIDGMMKEPRREEIPVKNKVVVESVYEMENRPPPPPVTLFDNEKRANLIFQLDAYYKRIKSILIRLRAYIYNYVSNIWMESNREKDRIVLLGSEYRLAIDKLDAFETPVGGILLAAVDNLASSNPNSWSLSALGCRNVVLKLGSLLWNVPERTYITQTGETLDVSSNKEKNRLYAYIDAYSRKVTADKQAMLCEAGDLVDSIYDRGSKGKKEIRHSEAQTLVVDTFHLIGLLNEVTELKPIDTLP